VPSGGKSMTTDGGKSMTTDGGKSMTTDGGKSMTTDGGKSMTTDGGKSMTRVRPDAPPCALPTIHLTTIPRIIPETPPDDHFARNNVPGRSLHFQGPIYAPCTEEGTQPLVSLLPTLPPLQRGMRSMLSDICRYHKRKKVMKKPRGADEEKEVKSIPPYIQTIASM